MRSGRWGRRACSPPGCYQFNLPDGGFVDLDAATTAVHHAEAALAAGELGRAQSEALTACIISRRPFLPGAEGPWTRARRQRLVDQQARAREVVAEVLLRKGDHRQAAREAARAVQLDPCREAAHRQLMRAHAGAGDRGLALRAFDRCRQVLREELGVDPSSDTQALHEELIGQR
jgi:DNA-binding SARP family transcriptional activator